jgi:hypothetical protein
MGATLIEGKAHGNGSPNMTLHHSENRNSQYVSAVSPAIIRASRAWAVALMRTRSIPRMSIRDPLLLSGITAQSVSREF